MAFLADSVRSKVGEKSRNDQPVKVHCPGVRGQGVAFSRLSRLSVRLAAALLACGLWSPGVGARSASEYELKAAFLYNFAKFVEWPPAVSEGQGDPMVICVVGEDPFGTILDETIKNKTVNGHTIVVRRLKSGHNVKGCHIVFIGSSQKVHLRSILDSLKGTSILTVGDAEGFAELGGVINFTLVEDHIHFEVNVDAAARAHLKISSKLLILAKIVRD